jgi:adenylosuccinate synthase
VLTGLGALRVCTSYRGSDGASFANFPYHQSVLHQSVGAYEELPGWDEDITGVRSESDLPQTTRDYLAFVSDFVGVPIGLVGVGPGRDQIVWTGDGLQSLAGRAVAAV